MDLIDSTDIKTGVISVITVCNIVANSLLIAVFLKYAELRGDCTALFILSLSVSDLATGLIVLPLNAAVCSSATPSVQHMTQYIPKINMICFSCSGFVSMHSQAWVALSKMVAILKPLTHEQLLSRTRCYGIMTCIWIAGIGVGAASLIFPTAWYVDVCTIKLKTDSRGLSAMMVAFYFVAYFVPEVASIYATARIFLVVVHVHRVVSAQEQSVGDQRGNRTGTVTMTAVRSARNILVICFVALALAIPLSVHVVMLFGFNIRDQKPPLFSFMAIWLYLCNTIFNSVLYMALHRSVRRKLRMLLVDVYGCVLCTTCRSTQITQQQ